MKLFSLSTVLLLAASCASTGAGDGDGWTSLMSADQWRGYKKQVVPEQWAFEDGAIHLTGGGAGDLITREMYGDFELRFQWRVGPRGNSGVMYLVLESEGPTYATGPEYQVLDTAWFGEEPRNPKTAAGANYDLHGIDEDHTRPMGEWNDSLIVVEGGHVEHWLNDELQCAYNLWTPEWQEAVAGSKWKNFPLYGLAKEGHIALQDHGDEVWYRGMEVRSQGAR